MLPDLVKATGATALGGMRCNPDSRMLEVLDPDRKYKALTHRYAWVHFKRGRISEPTFEPEPGLAYTINIPLSQNLLDRLGVKHILEVDFLSSEEIPAGFHFVGTQSRIRLLERD
jgi:hypothetical protein